MNTQVRLGGSAPPMVSLESSVDVWASVLLRVLSATWVATQELEPLRIFLLTRGEYMVMRAFAEGWAACPKTVPAAVPSSEDGTLPLDEVEAESCSVAEAGTYSSLVEPYVEA